MDILVVARDGNIDVTERGVSVTEGDNRNTDIRSFTDGLVVESRVANKEETRLFELQNRKSMVRQTMHGTIDARDKLEPTLTCLVIWLVKVPGV